MSVEQEQALEQVRRQLTIIAEGALDLDPPAAFHLWALRGPKNSVGKWFTSIDEAMEFVASERDRSDLYVCGGLRLTAPQSPFAGREVKDLGGVVGFLGDFDVKQGAFASVEDARLFAWNVFHGTPPSMLVQSGGGVQGWWLLKEPWTFNYPEERAKAIQFARRFGATLKAAGAAKGIRVDSTHDLARVFRLAGTFNRKPEYGEPRPTILELPAQGTAVGRYERDDLEVGLVAEEFTPKDPAKALPLMGFLTLAPDRSPPEDALQSLLVNHDKARGSWDGRRPDLADASDSSLDFSLATIAVASGWTDQEVADLLVAGRRHRGANLKTGKGGELRLDYYQRTIANAKAAVAKDKARSSGKVASATGAEEPRKVETPADAKKIIRDVWGVEVVRVEKAGNGTDRARYTIILPDERRVEVGSSSAMLDQRRMRAALYESRIVVAPLRPADWNAVVSAMNALVEEVAPEDDEAVETARWIAEFVSENWELHQARAGTPSSLWLKLQSKPDWFIHGGRIALELTRLRIDLFQKYGESVSTRALGQRLRNLGYSLTRLSARDGDRRLRRFYWLSPEGWDPFKEGGRGASVEGEEVDP
ncbi:hypothetical protein LBMAG48_14270 [Phycisphaerae bacterium]|nr:hypothetical protein LBMAG48_14270 [Phycisphaerae bacterium]